jgi:PAS domain S-box-containing protein
MDISIRTFAFIIGVTHFIQFIVIYYQFKLNKNYKGIGWWLLWSGIEVLGFLIIVIRSNFSTGSYLIVPQNSLIIAGTLFVYVGIMLFFGKKANWKIIITIFSLFVLSLSYFTFVNFDLIIRTVIINATLSLISFFTAYNLYKHKLNTVRSSANFLTVVLLIHGIIFTYLAITISFVNSIEYDIYSSNSFNIIQYTDAFIVGLTWTFGFIVMINQRLNAENKEEKDQLELIFNSSPDSVLITSLSGGYFLRINEGFLAITGYTKDDVSGKSTKEINLWKKPIERDTFVKTLKENGVLENEVYEFNRKDGSLFVGMVSARIIDLNGIQCVLSVTRDINERIRSEIKLKESEDRLTRAEKVARIGNWKLMLDTKELISSAGANFIYGIENRKLLLEDVRGFPLPEYRKLLDKALEDLISNHIPYNIEFKIQRPNDGRIIDIHSLAEYDKENNIVYGVIHDITDRKATDGEIQRKNEELNRINSEKDKFFSIIAHDLRSPFNGFLGLTELMVTDLQRMTLEDLNSIADNLHRSSKNLYRLLTNLLEWSKMQRGLTVYNPEGISLKNIVEENIQIFYESAKNKGIEIIQIIPEDIYFIADKRMLETTVRNLISNALKFTMKGGSVTISAVESNKHIEISVKDTGIGMNKDIVENLFKLDEQTSRQGTEKEPSTGLGLLLCKEFIEKHNGIISVNSEEGKGSEFIIRLPVTDNQ